MTEPGDADPVTAQLRLVWPNNLAAEPQLINQVLFSYDQGNPELIYMMFGHVGPRPWVTEEAADEGLAELGGTIDVEPRATLVASRTRALEIWEVLGRHLGILSPPEQ